MEVVPEKGGNFGEVDGGEVGPPFRGGGPAGGPQEKAVVVKVSVVCGLAVFRLAHGHHVDDLHMLILGGVGHHGIQQEGGLAGGVGHHYVQQIGRLAAGVGHHHPVPGTNPADGLLGGTEVLLIPGFPVHGKSLLCVILGPGTGPGS